MPAPLTSLHHSDAARLAVLQRAWREPQHKRIGLVGMGVTGQAMARLWLERGATDLVLLDQDTQAPMRGPAHPACTWRAGPMAADALGDCDLAILSPGIPLNLPAIDHAQAAGVPLFGELDLCQVARPDARMLAITGTNGKSTTTALTGQLVAAFAREPFVGGNLGEPVSTWLAQTSASKDAVVEISSAQMDGATFFVPKVAVVLNLSPDHLDRYGTMDAYAASKTRLVAALPPDGIAVLNADDPAVVAMAHACRAEILWFGAGALPAGASGARLGQDDALVGVGRMQDVLPSMSLEHPTLIGRHNRLNALAAVLATCAFCRGAKDIDSQLKAAYQRASGLPHRLRPVATVRDVLFVNDSKATNDVSAAIAIEAMGALRRPVVALLGGIDKGGGYAAVVGALERVAVRAVVIYGKARPQLREALSHRPDVLEADSLHQATAVAHARARAGDAILLSPACSSFDEFAHFRARGDFFEAWVHGLEG